MRKLSLLLIVLMLLPLPLRAQEATCDLEREDAFGYYMHEGGLRQGRGEYERALDAYACALRLEPDSTLVYVVRGNTHLSLGNNNAAIADYRRVIAQQPENAIAHHNLGFALYNMGDYEAAIQEYDTAIDIDPAYARAYNSRGLSYFRWDKNKEAIADFLKAIDLKIVPLVWPYQNLGLLYLEEEDYTEARKWLAEAVRVAPDDFTSHLWYANALYSLGLMDEALENYHRYDELYSGTVDTEVAERIRSLETRDSVIRFLPLMVIVVISVYWAALSLWGRWRRGTRPTEKTQPIPVLNPPRVQAPSVSPSIPLDEAPLPNRWRGVIWAGAFATVAAVVVGVVGRLLRRDQAL